jgi:arginase family enzyme
MVEVGLLDRGRAAGAAGVIGVPVDLQPGVRGGLQQQREILAPVAGDDAVGARCLDLGDVGREVGDLEQRMQFVADDLDVRPLGGQHGLGVVRTDWPNE